MAVVEDTLAGFTDKPSLGEDELGLDPILEGLFPAFSLEDDDFT